MLGRRINLVVLLNWDLKDPNFFMKKTKFILYNIIVIIFLFLLTELLVRLFYPSIQTLGTSKNLLVDQLYFNSPGLRKNASGESSGMVKKVNKNSFWKYSKTDTTGHIILYLGDSVAMGIGIENDSTFAGRINNSIGSINIINPSLIGYSHEDYVNLIKSLIVEQNNLFQVNEVNIFWCLNDIYSEAPDSNSPELTFGDSLNDVVNFFRRNSKLYHFLKKNFSDRPKTYYLYDRQFYNLSNQNYKSAVKSLRLISSILTNLNIDLKIILLPYEFELREGFKLSDTPQSLLSKSLNSADIQVYDLLPIISKKNTSSEDLYLYGDGIHFSNKGHKLIADILTKYLYVQNQ